MTWILVAIVGIIVFFAAVISPHAAGKIQHKTNVKSGKLKQIADWFWDPLTWLAKSSVEMTRKAIVKIAQLGKKTRRKASSDK